MHCMSGRQVNCLHAILSCNYFLALDRERREIERRYWKKRPKELIKEEEGPWFSCRYGSSFGSFLIKQYRNTDVNIKLCFVAVVFDGGCTLQYIFEELREIAINPVMLNFLSIVSNFPHRYVFHIYYCLFSCAASFCTTFITPVCFFCSYSLFSKNMSHCRRSC